jgi:3-hydroxymyristoyl/3-hydroxydecanoyl-(acyl carrier protein) dehydratase
MTIHKEQYDSTGKIVIAKMDITAKKPPFVNQVITWSDLLGTYNADTSTQLSGFMTNILNAAAAYGAVAAKTQGVPATAPVIPDSQTVATPAPLVSTPQATITQSDQSLK